MKVVFIFYISLLVCINAVRAQSIHGTVKDTTGNLISYAGISLITPERVVVAYTSTNENGLFSLSIPAANTGQPLLLEASVLGYKKQSKALTKFDISYDFLLSIDFKELKTVEIRDRRPNLKVRGDTINYKASDFTEDQDKVIGDVIKRLPGISVSDDGKISYNGKPISGFYIDGNNLLDDKYNIATTTVPNQIVDNVQIMEHHQPVKLLRRKSYSDDVALNITFKKNAKLALVGQAELGVGIPAKYEANVNGMTFKKRYNAVNYIKANNTGRDVSADLTAHNMAHYLKAHDYNPPDPLLSLGTAGNPNLPQSRILFNHSTLVNTNNLITLKKDIKVRTNINYLWDIRDQQYSKIEQIYALNDTVSYNERQKNKQRRNGFKAQLNINSNKDNSYLDNTLIGQSNILSAYSVLSSNGVNTHQDLENNRLDFSNELTYIKALNKKLTVNFYSYVNRITMPENLSITPGINDDLFNSGTSYKVLAQRTAIPTWIGNDYISLSLPIKHLIVSEKIGYSFQSQSLNSDMTLIQNDDAVTNAPDSSLNRLSWQKRRFYNELQTALVNSRFNFTVSLPVILQQTSYKDVQYELFQSAARFYFNPSMQSKFQTGVEHYLSFSYSLTNNTGTINDAYRAYILKNYRTLFANNSGLSEQKNQTATIGFFYRKAISLFFASINVSYRNRNANSITSTISTKDFQRRITLPYNDEAKGWDITGTISKYIFPLNTTITLNPTWQSNKQNIIQNGTLLPYKTHSLAFNAGWDTKISSAINVNFRSYIAAITNRSSVGKSISGLKQLNQHGEINYTIIRNLFLKLSGDYYSNRQQQFNNTNYFFCDFNVRLSFPKSRVSIELDTRNIFNTTSYNTIYLYGNVFSSDIYNIPGRTILGKIAFTY